MARDAEYEVVVGINYPTSPDAIKRILAGEYVPAHERKNKRAEPGQVVSDIPSCSVPWLLEQGQIRRRQPAAPAIPVAPMLVDEEDNEDG
jgi:hypothetical protein